MVYQFEGDQQPPKRGRALRREYHKKYDKPLHVLEAKEAEEQEEWTQQQK